MSNSTNLLFTIILGVAFIIVGIMNRDPEVANVFSTALIAIGTIVIARALVQGLFPRLGNMSSGSDDIDFDVPDLSELKRKRLGHR